MNKGKRQKGRSAKKGALSTINKIVDLCRRGEPSDVTFLKALEALKKLVAFDAATIYLCDPGSGQLRQVASIEGPVEILEFLSIEQGEGITGWTADAGKPVLLADRSRHHDFDPDTDYASFMSVPLMSAGKTVGVLNLGSKTPEAFSNDEVELVTLVAAQVAMSFENVLYEKRLTELKADLDRMQKQLRASDTRPPAGILVSEIKDLVARINHDINNSLAILIGNLQCMLMEKTVADQKTLSRLRRMERALMKVNDANHRLLELIRMTSQDGAAETGAASSDGKVLTKNV
ncbi:MAG: GAF domain-containing protein [Candidatus Zixiibacteriota bacterium]|nr:MAG: GAF domain-containing protein [candidate division Zixibacteria bacterium]